jgi:hypothetical protein
LWASLLRWGDAFYSGGVAICGGFLGLGGDVARRQIWEIWVRMGADTLIASGVILRLVRDWLSIGLRVGWDAGGLLDIRAGGTPGI